MSEREFSVAVVGVGYPNADGSNRLFVIRTCAPGDPIDLRPEPRNRHDPAAIAVFDARGDQLGYLPADRCVWIGAQMRAHPITAIFQEETPYGAAIRLRIGEGMPTLPIARRLQPTEDRDAIDPDGPVWGA